MKVKIQIIPDNNSDLYFPDSKWKDKTRTFKTRFILDKILGKLISSRFPRIFIVQIGSHTREIINETGKTWEELDSNHVVTGEGNNDDPNIETLTKELDKKIKEFNKTLQKVKEPKDEKGIELIARGKALIDEYLKIEKPSSEDITKNNELLNGIIQQLSEIEEFKKNKWFFLRK